MCVTWLRLSKRGPTSGRPRAKRVGAVDPQIRQVGQFASQLLQGRGAECIVGVDIQKTQLFELRQVAQSFVGVIFPVHIGINEMDPGNRKVLEVRQRPKISQASVGHSLRQMQAFQGRKAADVPQAPIRDVGPVQPRGLQAGQMGDTGMHSSDGLTGSLSKMVIPNS